jgi:hypothetical protein
LTIGRVRIAGPIVLAQHNGNKAIGKAQTTVCSVLPIFIEIAYYFAVLTGIRKMFNMRQQPIKNFKIMPSATDQRLALF